MGVFFVLLLIPIMMQHIAIRGIHFDYQKRNRAAMAFFFVWLTLLVMLRHKSVGNDTSNYINFFHRFARMDWGTVRAIAIETGFAYFNKVVSLLSDDPQFFLAMAAIAVSIMIYPTYKRLCVDASLTVTLFCFLSTFVMMFSGIRQMLAIGIGFVAYEFTRNKKMIPFSLMVLLAISFHTSAFILAFMYPLYYARITKKGLFVLIPALVVCFAFNKPIFSVLTIILAQFTAYETEITSTGAYMMLILFAAFVVFSFVIPDETRMDKETIGLRNFLLLSFLVQMFAPLHALAMRMNYYYIIFIPLLLPKIIECRSKRWNQVAVLGRHVMVLFFLAYFFVVIPKGENLHVFPYRFFWENIG